MLIHYLPVGSHRRVVYVGVKFHQDAGGMSPKTYYYKAPEDTLVIIGNYAIVCVSGKYCIVKVVDRTSSAPGGFKDSQLKSLSAIQE